MKDTPMNIAKVAVAIIIAAIILGFAARNYFSGHQTPAGQPRLGGLTRASLGALRSTFNRDSGQIRIILLLSPT